MLNQLDLVKTDNRFVFIQSTGANAKSVSLAAIDYERDTRLHVIIIDKEDGTYDIIRLFTVRKHEPVRSESRGVCINFVEGYAKSWFKYELAAK